MISGIIRVGVTAATALAWMSAGASAGVDSSTTRPTPTLTRAVSMKCENDSENCKRAAWLSFLKSRDLSELQAPSGGRAYRWLWEGPLLVHGYVQLIVQPDGAGDMASSRNSKHLAVSTKDVVRFEAALAQSGFVGAKPGGGDCLDECQDQLLEVVVDGRYHYVQPDGVVDEKGGIRAAALILERLAGFTTPTKEDIARASIITGTQP